MGEMEKGINSTKERAKNNKDGQKKKKKKGLKSYLAKTVEFLDVVMREYAREFLWFANDKDGTGTLK